MLMVKTEVDGVTRFINIEHVAAVKYGKEFDPCDPDKLMSVLILHSSVPGLGILKMTGDLADATKAALETACYITEGALRG